MTSIKIHLRQWRVLGWDRSYLANYKGKINLYENEQTFRYLQIRYEKTIKQELVITLGNNFT